jgi:hypothetical protein
MYDHGLRLGEGLGKKPKPRVWFGPRGRGPSRIVIRNRLPAALRRRQVARYRFPNFLLIGKRDFSLRVLNAAWNRDRNSTQ